MRVRKGKETPCSSALHHSDLGPSGLICTQPFSARISPLRPPHLNLCALGASCRGASIRPPPHDCDALEPARNATAPLKPCVKAAPREASPNTHAGAHSSAPASRQPIHPPHPRSRLSWQRRTHPPVPDPLPAPTPVSDRAPPTHGLESRRMPACLPTTSVRTAQGLLLLVRTQDTTTTTTTPSRGSQLTRACPPRPPSFPAPPVPSPLCRPWLRHRPPSQRRLPQPQTASSGRPASWRRSTLHGRVPAPGPQAGRGSDRVAATLDGLVTAS